MTHYSEITEIPGLKASQEQIARLYHRYRFAKSFAVGKDVLEVACGAGLGLGYLAQVAKSVVGGDLDDKNVELARKHYMDRIPIMKMDAHSLPFPERFFDLVLLFEAIYYLQDPEKFVSEAKRVMRNGGTLIIGTVNKDWEDFHPSPYSYKYFSVPKLYELLRKNFGEVRLFGAFQVENTTMKDKMLSIIKRAAVKLNLIPGSLKARSYLKRIFMGKLTPLPEEVFEGMASYDEPLQIAPDQPNSVFKIIYAVATK
jgi:SAM-dependent methyltransferase